MTSYGCLLAEKKTMSEEIPIIRRREFRYEGIFQIKDIFDIIHTFHLERNYDMYDKKHMVIDSKKGRIIDWETQLDKQYSDEEIFRMRFYMTFTEVKDVEIVHNGKKITVNKGKVHIRFKGHLVVDETNAWKAGGNSPNADGFRLLVRYIGTFFVFRHHLDTFKKDAKKDSEQLYQLILDYFNARKYLK